MDFLKENKDGGKVSSPPSTRRVCAGSPHPHTAHALRTPICASAQVVNERGEMRLEDLPPPLVNEIRSTQRRYDARAAHRWSDTLCALSCLHPFPATPRYRYQEELDAMSSDPYGLQFQALLQAPSHSSRLDIFSKIIGEEQKRLAAREQLKSMFKGVGDS